MAKMLGRRWSSGYAYIVATRPLEGTRTPGWGNGRDFRPVMYERSFDRVANVKRERTHPDSEMVLATASRHRSLGRVREHPAGTANR